MKTTQLTPQQIFRFASAAIRIEKTGLGNRCKGPNYREVEFCPAYPKGNKGKIDKMISRLGRQYPLGKFAPIPKPSIRTLYAKKMWKLIKSRRTSVPTGMDEGELCLEHRSHGMTLMSADYKYKYSRAAGTWSQKGVWLMGQDDGGWVVRVPSSCHTVDDAIEWMTPIVVHNKISEGCHVPRQGDIWLIPMRIKEHDFGVIGGGSSHSPSVDGNTVTLSHPQHETLVATAPKGHKWRAVQAKQIGGGGD